MTAVIRVLESFPEPGPETNPYIVQLRDALASSEEVDPTCWSWRAALLGRYDVFHTHWTEALIERRGRRSTWLRWLLFSAFLVRLRVQRIPVVRTLHNLDRPQGISRVESLLLASVERLTSFAIVLNDSTPVPPGIASSVIAHGHYRDWFASYARPAAVPGRLAFIGKVRRYKNVEGLVRAVREVPQGDTPLSLHVAGKPSTPELVSTLRDLAADDPRISLSLDFVEDEGLVREVSEAELVVLPYHEMHNSGSVLAALSLDRPVLVPDNEFNRALEREVGSGWVLTFDGALTGQTLRGALQRVENVERSARPDLGARDWSRAGEQHAAAFRAATSRGR